MGNTLKKKKGFSMPHVYAVILILMLLVTIMTYVIPAGTYARVDGNVDPNSFTYVEQTPVSFLSFFTSLHQGFVESANVIGAVLLISGAIQIIQKTGAFSAGIQALIKRAKGRDGTSALHDLHRHGRHRLPGCPLSLLSHYHLSVHHPGL
mgnify:CR=1 FL=1